jgi:hypothetical protein
MKSANYLGVKPWVLGGIETDETRIPICWQWWAWEIVNAEAAAQERRLHSLLTPG